MKWILASASPRRKEILSKMGFSFDIVTADIDETLDDGILPKDGVVILAVKKGDAVAKRFPPDVAVISSDTLVELDGVALGKPKDEEDAKCMLGALSGKRHKVRTGVALHYGGRVFADVATANVYFKPLTEEQIDAYVKTGEPMDKAGAYGIQGKGGALVDRMEGDFDTVMGLSSRLLTALIEKAGITPCV